MRSMRTWTQTSSAGRVAPSGSPPSADLPSATFGRAVRGRRRGRARLSGRYSGPLREMWGHLDGRGHDGARFLRLRQLAVHGAAVRTLSAEPAGGRAGALGGRAAVRTDSGTGIRLQALRGIVGGRSGRRSARAAD